MNKRIVIGDTKIGTKFNQFLYDVNTPDLINIVKGGATQELHLPDTIKRDQGIKIQQMYNHCVY